MGLKNWFDILEGDLVWLRGAIRDLNSYKNKHEAGFDELLARAQAAGLSDLASATNAQINTVLFEGRGTANDVTEAKAALKGIEAMMTVAKAESPNMPALDN